VENAVAAPISSFVKPPVKHLASDFDLSVDDLAALLDLAAQMKRAPGRFSNKLAAHPDDV
jgi:ornithine carbamoyltransferase